MEVKTNLLNVIIIGMLSGAFGYEASSNRSLQTYRSFFNYFPLAPLTVVQFSNEKCDAGDGTSGTCMAKVECMKKGGTLKGSCAQGFGTCCVMIAKENGVVYGNNTLLQKSQFNEGVHITYTVLRMSEDVCQFRLDVKNLTLYEVEMDGNCDHDYMTINQDTKFKKVCGMTADVHYYIDVFDDNVLFTFHTDPEKSYNREWKIYVSQYTCDMGAPEGCGQWYLGTSNTIDIWNNVDPDNTHWYYLDHQVYTICVRWEAGYCSITYTEATRFQPRCDDLLERPAMSELITTCVVTPPSQSTTYTFTTGVQNFFVNFSDTTNQHIGSAMNPFRNPSISYQQNLCT